MDSKNKPVPRSRRLELMLKRFDVDEENKIVKLNYHYDKVSDVLEGNLDTKVPSFDRNKFSEIKENISDFPIEYKTDLSFQIDDYEGYSPDDILDSFDDAVELSYISSSKDHRKKGLQIVFCLITGVFILYLLARGLLGEWTGFLDSTKEIIKEVFDIGAWVFIWQAVSLMFLTPTEGRLVYLTLSKRVRDIKLLDKEGNVIKHEKYEESNLHGLGEKKKHSFARYLLLTTGAAFFALGLINVIDVVTSFVSMFAIISSSPEPGNVALVFSIFIGVGIIAVTLQILAGIAGIGAFVDRHKKLQKCLIPFGVALFAIEGTLLVYTIASGAKFVSMIIGTLVSAAYLAGGIILLVTKKK